MFSTAYPRVRIASARHAREIPLQAGLLFLPFWIMGVLILITPLHAPDEDVTDPTSPRAWLPEKTEAEKAVISLTSEKQS
ncbi:hypothetical protein AAF712_012713 [Marasmius tenuissimus]|uniref:Uncharacterized protein n=1 Tax=Marasmius tenuissimus TaxID=585030 RepID=A0ABR2ZFP9_9AGAR